jgi:glycosyltransferase involved in cell wall biosynthesis
VIVAERTALPEVCGDAGVFVDPSEPQSIAHAIDSLLSDGAFYDRKRAAGIQRARGYTWAATATALMKSILLASGSREG